MLTKLTTAGLVLAVTLPAAALAGSDLKMDADGDGAVSMTEFNEALPDAGASVFAEIDVDASGTLTEEEIAAAVEGGLLPEMSSEG